MTQPREGGEPVWPTAGNRKPRKMEARGKLAEDIVEMLASAQPGEMFEIIAAAWETTFYLKRITRDEYERAEGYGEHTPR